MLLTEIQYFPSIDYYRGSIEESDWIFESYERWGKGAFFNRCYIAGPNNPLLLSVPLEKGREQKTILKDVKISYQESWQLRHWRSIHDAYRRSPWFEHYHFTLEPIFTRRPVFLADWNLLLMEWVWKQLKLPVMVGFTDSFHANYPNPEWKDNRGQYNIRPVGPEEVNYRYPQVFEERHGFIGNLSILDLLFCEGPSAKSIL